MTRTPHPPQGEKIAPARTRKSLARAAALRANLKRRKKIQKAAPAVTKVHADV
jgi:hypothetical protein